MSIKYIRKLRNMSQKQLADAIGVNHSIISKYEANLVIPPANRLEAIAKVLDVDIDRLIKNEDEEPYIFLSKQSTPFRNINDDKRHLPVSLLAKMLINYCGGICELCGNPAPFTGKNGQPYLEYHHVIWLSQGGSSTVDNIVVLCPNCHRKVHELNDPEDFQKLKEAAQRHNIDEIMKSNI